MVIFSGFIQMDTAPTDRPKTERVLSVDIGIKNLALVLFENGAATEGKVHDIRRPNLRESTEAAVDAVSLYFPLNRILIEQQPSQNLRMNPMMHGLLGAARAWGIETVVVSPQLRQRVLGLENYRESTYAQRKRAAVVAADLRFPTYRQWLDAGQKADDLADALLQYTVWVDVNSNGARPKRNRRAKSPINQQSDSASCS